jgi:hypothetical protein
MQLAREQLLRCQLRLTALALRLPMLLVRQEPAMPMAPETLRTLSLMSITTLQPEPTLPIALVVTALQVQVPIQVPLPARAAT